jgi:hypothetical protein
VPPAGPKKFRWTTENGWKSLAAAKRINPEKFGCAVWAVIKRLSERNKIQAKNMNPCKSLSAKSSGYNKFKSEILYFVSKPYGPGWFEVIKYDVPNRIGFWLPNRLDLKEIYPGFCTNRFGMEQFALALLADALGDDRQALEGYRSFLAKELGPVLEPELAGSKFRVKNSVLGYLRVTKKPGRKSNRQISVEFCDEFELSDF